MTIILSSNNLQIFVWMDQLFCPKDLKKYWKFPYWSPCKEDIFKSICFGMYLFQPKLHSFLNQTSNFWCLNPNCYHFMMLKENSPFVHMDVQTMLMVTVVNWINKFLSLCSFDRESWVSPAHTAVLAVPTCTRMHCAQALEVTKWLSVRSSKSTSKSGTAKGVPTPGNPVPCLSGGGWRPLWRSYGAPEWSQNPLIAIAHSRSLLAQ